MWLWDKGTNCLHIFLLFVNYSVPDLMFRIIMYSISLLITGGLNLFSLTWHSDVEFENYSCILYVDMWILVSPMSEDAVYIVVKLCNTRDPLIWSICQVDISASLIFGVVGCWVLDFEIFSCHEYFFGLVFFFLALDIFWPFGSEWAFDFFFFFLSIFFLLPQCKIIRPLWYIGRLILAEEFNCMYRPQTYMNDCILITLFAGTNYSNTHCKLKIFCVFECLKPFFAPPISLVYSNAPAM